MSARDDEAESSTCGSNKDEIAVKQVRVQNGVCLEARGIPTQNMHFYSLQTASCPMHLGENHLEDLCAMPREALCLPLPQGEPLSVRSKFNHRIGPLCPVYHSTSSSSMPTADSLCLVVILY